jgi:hypothetical protein
VTLGFQPPRFELLCEALVNGELIRFEDASVERAVVIQNGAIRNQVEAITESGFRFDGRLVADSTEVLGVLVNPGGEELYLALTK